MVKVNLNFLLRPVPTALAGERAGSTVHRCQSDTVRGTEEQERGELLPGLSKHYPCPAQTAGSHRHRSWRAALRPTIRAPGHHLMPSKVWAGVCSLLDPVNSQSQESPA